jgi:hypothetical protein
MFGIKKKNAMTGPIDIKSAENLDYGSYYLLHIMVHQSELQDTTSLLVVHSFTLFKKKKHAVVAFSHCCVFIMPQMNI